MPYSQDIQLGGRSSFVYGRRPKDPFSHEMYNAPTAGSSRFSQNTQKLSFSFVALFVAFIFLLDFALLPLGRRSNITLAMLVFPLLFFHYFHLRANFNYLLCLSISLLLPVIPWLYFEWTFDALLNFAITYLNWAANVAILLAAWFFPLKWGRRTLLYSVQVSLLLLVFFSVCQSVSINLFGFDTFYYPYGGMHSLDEEVERWYLPVVSVYRSIGPYYESSIFARIVITLWLMALFLSQKWLWPTLIAGLGVIVSVSAGNVIFFVLFLIIFFLSRVRFTSNGIIIFLVSGLLVLPLVLFVFGPWLEIVYVFSAERLSTMFSEGNTSQYYRVGAAFYALSNLLPVYLFGVPLGNDQLVIGAFTSDVLYGAFEMTLYFGLIAIILFAWCAGYVLYSIFQRRANAALFWFYVLLAPTVSGAYIQLVINIFIVFFICAYRYSCKTQFEERYTFWHSPVHSNFGRSRR